MKSRSEVRGYSYNACLKMMSRTISMTGLALAANKLTLLQERHFNARLVVKL